MIVLAASTTGTILATLVAFLLITLLLVALLLTVKQKLSPTGPVTLTINGEKKLEVASGSTLLTTLGNQKIFPALIQEDLFIMRLNFLLEENWILNSLNLQFMLVLVLSI